MKQFIKIYTDWSQVFESSSFLGASRIVQVVQPVCSQKIDETILSHNRCFVKSVFFSSVYLF